MRPVAQTFHFHKVGDWQWVSDHLGWFWSLSLDHLYLALVPVLIGLAAALPLGVMAVRASSTYGPLLGTTTVLYSLPSLAAFAVLLPFTGLSDSTVMIPLSVYATTILVRSVADGLRSVPEEVRLAASAMGYGQLRRLAGVELPASLPVLVAGLRVATVASISLVTVGALVGKGGFGLLFTEGEQNDFLTEVLAGVVLVVFWALVFDGLIVLSGWILTPWARRRS